MSGDVSDKKRLISVTQGNINNSHIYISGTDFSRFVKYLLA
jgi:hypothetical protein